MNKYYHRGKGECVCPTDDVPFCFQQYVSGTALLYPSTRQSCIDFSNHIKSLPVAYHCSPDLPVGWFEGKEVYQVSGEKSNVWVVSTKAIYKEWTGEKRIWIEPVAERGMTINTGNGSASNLLNYEQEAGALHPNIPSEKRLSLPFSMFQEEKRAAHIKARQMAEREIRELREENERLKTIIELVFHSKYQDDEFEYVEDKWQQFKQQNNIS